MIRAVLTDIEGTTSSIRFVHQVLFPYARAHLREFVLGHAAEPAVQAQLDAVRRECGAALEIEAIVQQLIDWIDADRKITPLKALQGMIWETGYRKGDFTGHVYADAAAQLRAWHAAGLKLYIFSSGSVQAQQLLFGHSDAGDLTPLFSGYFDTRIGNKQDPAAYRAIAADTGIAAAETLFLSDIRAELDAAQSAGMHTTMLLREGSPDPACPHRQVSDFTAIQPAAGA
jgi:enolase-phosphatase E1